MPRIVVENSGVAVLSSSRTYRGFGNKGTYSVGVPERFDHVRRINYSVYT